MKLVIVLCSLVLLLASCHRHHRNTSISISENGDVLRLNAYYNPDKTHSLQRYLDRKLGYASNISFNNTRMDATITLDDETRFYMKSKPGYLSIRFNRNENTVEAYERMRGVFEGIKGVVH